MSIEKHEFTDMYKPKVLSANETAVSLDTERTAWIALFRNDVIALAKHFNLTADDIK